MGCVSGWRFCDAGSVAGQCGVARSKYRSGVEVLLGGCVLCALGFWAVSGFVGWLHCASGGGG